MSGSMAFFPELRAFLKAQGAIHTIRKYKASYGLVQIEGVGLCRRIPISTVCRVADLIPYVASSGFDTAEAWWAKVKSFYPSDSAPKYLYRVEMYLKGGA